MCTIGIDPGPYGYAYAVLDEDGRTVLGIGEVVWDEDRDPMGNPCASFSGQCVRDLGELVRVGDLAVIERIQSYGAPMGKPTIQTCEVIGMLSAALKMLKRPVLFEYRTTIRAHLCGRRSSEKDVRGRLYQICAGIEPRQKGWNTHTQAALAAAVVGFDHQKLFAFDPLHAYKMQRRKTC